MKSTPKNSTIFRLYLNIIRNTKKTFFQIKVVSFHFHHRLVKLFIKSYKVNKKINFV